MKSYNYSKSLGLLLLVTLFFNGCVGQLPGGTATAPRDQPLSPVLSPGSGVLLPGQISSSRINQVVKIEGQVVQVIQNPGGQGGLYIKLMGGGGEVGLRIEQSRLNEISDTQKAQFEVGRVVTAEGMVVQSGTELVIVFGVVPSAIEKPRVGNATFVVKVPENTIVTYSVFMELVNEQRQLLGFVKMEPKDPVTWTISIPAGPDKFGYRYTRDGIGFPTAEEFSPDSEKTFRWPSPSPGMVINDIVSKWRWFPESGYVMPVIESTANTAGLVKRINNDRFQCGYGFVDFWWSPFHDLVYGTSVAMHRANGNWIKIMPPIGFNQVEPIPKMNWEAVPDNPIYPSGELEYHIAQAQKAGLNVFLVPQCGILNGTLMLDGSKQYSEEWWRSYFKEMERYSTYFADLAEKAGVKYMAFQDNEMWNSPKAPINIKEKYGEYISNIRQHYSGKLGMVWSLGGSYKSPAEIFPVGYLPEKFDFFAIGGPQAIADSRSPSVAEMKGNFATILEKAVKPLYVKYQKAVILYSAGYPSIDGASSRDFAQDDPAMDVFEVYSDKYQLDLREQAEAFEAIMQVVAETPYITGFYPFNNYWPTPFPQSKNPTTWGKPADKVMAGWYQRLAASGN
jgi:hypothetical protein